MDVKPHGNRSKSPRASAQGSRYVSAASPSKNKTKTKFAKPKHLKRKLEVLAPDDPRHQQLLGTLTSWEQQKQEYIGTKIGTSVASKSVLPPVERRVSFDPPKKTAKLPDPIKTASPAEKANDMSDNKPTRQRGQRRRGRKDTSGATEVSEATTTPTSGTTTATSAVVAGADTESKPCVSETVQSSAVREPKRRSIKRQGDPRYCVGRKPVTDFEVGSKHDGKVVYVKPFGIFIDIGCHSDAFCHVSRLSDEFVENPLTMFQPGDDIKNVRIVETDRQKKRITVSLQSEKRIEDEKISLESRLDRKKKRRTSGPNKPTVSANEKRPQRSLPSDGPATGDSMSDHTLGTSQTAHSSVEENSAKELKRQQKLERRAARREQQQLGDQ